MSLRTILAPLSCTEQDRHALRNALAVAAPFGAHVTALLPGGPLSTIIAEEPRAPRLREDSLVREGRAMLVRRREAARAMFDEVVRETGAVVAEEPGEGVGATVHFEARHGDDPEVIREAAVVHDLVLFHRDVEDPEQGPEPPEVKNALQSCGRPLLVVPTRMPEPFAARVAIAWNGSLEGAHAVSAALPLIGRAASVHVLTAATPKTEAEQGDRLRRYLGWHGVAATVHAVEAGAPSVGAALLAKAGDVAADLLVMGGYSHSRIRQTMLGGVTHHVLHHAALSVLLSR
jgi:nucleotide-binding universal stress UspA family protein